MANDLALGVFTRLSDDPIATLKDVADLGIYTIQTPYPSHLDSAEGIESVKKALESSGIEITTVFCGFAGESYADIPTVQKTVGLVPKDTREARTAQTLKVAEFARKIGVKRVAAHIGFIPSDLDDPNYLGVAHTLKSICDELYKHGQVFALETGQETAIELRHFIIDVDRRNLRVNFDPANMILYGKDKPIQALDILGRWIDGVHLKDGCWPTSPGKLGEEMPIGEGDVNFPSWLTKLLNIGYKGPLTIEREISGPKQIEDIKKAKAYIEKLIQDYNDLAI